MILAIVLIGLWPAKAETWISTPVLSYHFDRDSDKNEHNIGIGVEHSLSERVRLASGIFRNSNRIDSGYLVAVRCAYRSTNWCAGALAGGVTGYEKHAIVIGGLALSYEQKAWGANLLLFPKGGGVLGFQIKWRID